MSMGVLRVHAKEFIGHRFGRLVILSTKPNKIGSGSRSIATVQCDCGKIKEIGLSNIKSGKTNSCGCLNAEMASAHCKTLNTDHGLSRHPLYIVWTAMHNRCYNPNDVSYPNYGAKGVAICEEWYSDFMSFYNWGILNGWKEGLQLDKDIVGNGKLYSPETCCFVTRKENGRKKKNNRLFTINGETKPLSEWCERLNLKYSTVYMRIKRGAEPSKAFV
jgi:hypothetical protein